MRRLLLGTLLFATLHSALASGPASPPATVPSPEALWYEQPAKNWMTEALPLGNGRVGAMFFGGVTREQIQFNEESLWNGRPQKLIHESSTKAFAGTIDLLKQGKFG